MSETEKPLLIKRYASRRLYNTETSDYVTLDDISGFIRAGREIKIIDLKSGDDLTRQYLLQIVADHESRGESVLPVPVLTDLVRSYTSQAQSVVPQFLAASFEMLRESQSKMMENLSSMPNGMQPLNPISGFEAMQRQQKAFLAGLVPRWTDPNATPETDLQAEQPSAAAATAELEEIKQQLADLKQEMNELKKD